MPCISINKRLFPFVLLLVAACAAPPPRPTPSDVVREVPPVFLLDGRIGVRFDGQGYFGSLNWQHARGNDEMLLLSPLGQAVARIERDATGVRLDMSGTLYQAADASELTARVLGWRLPLEGLVYWIGGLPQPGAPAEVERDESWNVTHLRQHGWDIEYRDYQMQGQYALPSRLVLRNAGLELKLVVDRWEPQP